jgi:cytochrome c oxidase subunit 2
MFRNLITVLTITFVAVLVGQGTVWAQAGQPATEEAAPVAAPAAQPAAPAAQPAAPAPAPTAEPAAAPTAEPAAAPTAEPAAAPTAEPAAAPAAAPAAEKKAEAEEKVWDLTDQQLDSYWMPTKANSMSDHVDWMFYAILGLSAFCFIAITIAVVYLTWRYRARPGHKTEPSRAHDNVLEVTWTIIPSIICVFIFIGGWKGYLNMTTAPGDANEVNVIGQKWIWSFTYDYGLDSFAHGELHVPVDRPTKLVMRSEDVLHSFFVPAFRAKQDVIPGRYSYIWFEPDKAGVYRVYCTEYCGDAHWDMKTKVIVHEPGGYEKWLEEEYAKTQIDCKDVPEAERDECYKSQGEKLYVSKGCKQCHSLDGTAGTGPTFQGMWGQSRSFTDGTSATVDENYVRESILDPMVKIRSGFNPVMPTFKGKLKDKDIDAFNNWMKSL